MTITAQSILDNKPSESEVERVETVWEMFDSTTQFLEALRQVLKSRVDSGEHVVLEQFLPKMAQVEANELNTPILPAERKKEFWGDACWRESGSPITQRAIPK